MSIYQIMMIPKSPIPNTNLILFFKTIDAANSALANIQKVVAGNATTECIKQEDEFGHIFIGHKDNLLYACFIDSDKQMELQLIRQQEMRSMMPPEGAHISPANKLQSN